MNLGEGQVQSVEEVLGGSDLVSERNESMANLSGFGDANIREVEEIAAVLHKLERRSLSL